MVQGFIVCCTRQMETALGRALGDDEIFQHVDEDDEEEEL